jgi:predicted RND superfamily exporter protein
VSVNNANQAKASDRSDPFVNRASKPHALGLERIGLISLRFPLLVGLATIVLLIAAVLGVARIKVDDSPSQLFRSDTPEFKTFEEVTQRFPSNEFDVLIVVEGKNLLERASIEKLRDLVTDLQLIEGTRGIISLFSARPPPKGSRAACAAVC